MQLLQPILVTSDLVRSYKMDKIEYKTDSFGTEHVLIYKEDGGITSMPKELYDKQQAEQSTPNLAD